MRRRDPTPPEPALLLVGTLFSKEDIYPKAYECGRTLFHGLDRYFNFFNYKRPHQALGYKTPAALYGAALLN